MVWIDREYDHAVDDRQKRSSWLDATGAGAIIRVSAIAGCAAIWAIVILAVIGDI